MENLTIVYLLRHAESHTDPNIPQSEWPLTQRGRQQAESLKSCLANLAIDCIYSSPYARAVETVTPFAEQAGLGIARIEGLRERKVTQGFASNWLEVIKHSWENFEFALPQCESSVQCQMRIVQTLRHLVEMRRGKILLVSSHGNAIALYLQALNPAYGFDRWMAMKNPELFKIYYYGNEPLWDQVFTLELSSST